MQRPPPLRTDGSNAFASYSMRERVPRIARDVVDRNPNYPATVKQAIERLACSIEQNAPVPAPSSPAPDVPSWSTAHAEHVSETWLSAEWFYAELAFYRELVLACRFWETNRDPFAPVKEEELAGARPWSRLEEVVAPSGGTRAQRLERLLEACLWGNRVDMSYMVAASRVRGEPEELLADERATATPLLARPGVHVQFVADNAGTELAIDLALAGAILEDPSARVTFQLKIQPMFVSDAMPRDVWHLLDRMQSRSGLLRALADHLAACFELGRLSLASDPFWTGPHFLWNAPAHLRAELASATLVVIKGDANYRRLIGDALWAPATPLADACAYVTSPILCLRTMKSDPVVGLRQGLAETLDVAQPRWRIDGQRGVIQTTAPSGTPGRHSSPSPR